MDSDDQGVSTPGAALLLIVGEPFTEEQKTLILVEITKGFRCWDVEDTGIDINEELAQIANRASLGEESINGERMIQHQSDNLAIEILINPLAQSLKTSIKKLLIAHAPTKYIIFAGYAFQGSGAWVLQDDAFAFSNLAQVFKNTDVENALKQNIEANLTIHTVADSNWGTNISKADFTNNLRIQLNPPEKLDNIHGVLQFTAYVGGFIRVVPITSLLQASEQFGNISFTRPTLYIFPGCQGDSALFGINGFNLLVNGGYSRRACFWDFARHLDRVDAMLMTHLGTDNIFGLNTVLQRKSLENIHPQIGYLYFNAPEKWGALPSQESGDSATSKTSSLLINLAEEANKMTQLAKELGISPHPCSRGSTAANCEPINLYHKLGHGSLDMYVLNPITDSKELKEFYQLWSKQSVNLDAGGPFSLPNALSVCTLLVWKPYNLDEKIVRILFTGNAPQQKIIEGFEKMKSLGFLKLASCTTRDLMKPPPVKKPLVGLNKSGGKGQPKAPVPTRTETARGMSGKIESPRREAKAIPGKTESKVLSPTKPAKTVKSENNKKEKEKPKTSEKETKPRSVPSKENEKDTRVKKDVRSMSATSPVKASSPGKSPSPPKSLSPPKSPTKTKAPAAAVAKAHESKSVAAAAAVVAPVDQVASADAPAVNHVDDHSLKPESEQGQVTCQDQVPTHASEGAISEARDAVGAIDDMSVSISSAADRKKLEDFGIFEGEQKVDYSNGSGTYEFEEEERPQALPEPPVMIESPSLETDTMPDYSSKIESDEQELSEFSRAEEELMELECRSEAKSLDPAEEIPLSPEPSLEEHQDFQFPSLVEPQSSFETPIFTNDEPNSNTSTSRPPVEHNIQYGIDDSSNGRDMGGIQEVDEEEPEDNCTKTTKGKVKNNSDEHQRLSIYKDEGDEIKDDDENGFEIDSDPDSEFIKQKIPYKDQKEELAGVSPERQFNNEVQEAVDEGIEDDDNSSLPIVSDKDSSPEVGIDEKHLEEQLAEKSFTESDDRDSLDGCIPGEDEAVKKPASSIVNGSVFESAGEISHAHDQKASTAHHFIGAQGQEDDAHSQHFGDESDDERAAPFDPVATWGQPMGLPSPPPESSVEGKKGAAARSNGTDKRPATSNAPKPGTSSNDTRAARHASATSDAKKRPATAPSTSSRGGSQSSSTPRRPGTASSRAPSSNTKTSPLPPITPFYVDLTYIPNHGDSAYSDVEFFKRIRARNYVISSLSPNPQVLDSLMEAKGSWEQKDLEVTIIPTYDNDTLRHWMGLNKEKLQELRVDMAPAVSRCTIKLQDLETSLPAFRLEV